ncbi:hypothetical protein [Fodinicola acaciae]|uniref:hypothetical protein n=1 Tax=Fodinicola acaciae TaxID=2681555 RepID=UPI0013D4F66D|nr:hypothetical protein [Fodinicola acaciae]
MTKEEALRLLRLMVKLAPETDPDPLWACEPWEEGFTNAPLSEQMRYRDAAVLLATSRYSRSPNFVWDLLALSGVEAEQLVGLVRRYLTDRDAGAGRILSAHPDQLSDADLDELTQVFVADVGRDLWLAEALLKRRPFGEAWDALAGFLMAVEDPWQVRTVCVVLDRVDTGLARLGSDDERLRAYRRMCAFVKIMNGRPRRLAALANSYAQLEVKPSVDRLICYTCSGPSGGCPAIVDG